MIWWSMKSVCGHRVYDKGDGGGESKCLSSTSGPLKFRSPSWRSLAHTIVVEMDTDDRHQ